MGVVRVGELASVGPPGPGLDAVVEPAEAREVVRNSFEVKCYEPKTDKALWDDAYARFKKLIGE